MPLTTVSHYSIKGAYDCLGLELVTDASGRAVYFEFVAHPSVAKAVTAYLVSNDYRNSSGLRWLEEMPIFFGEGNRLWHKAVRHEASRMDNVVIAHLGLGAAGTVPEIYLLGNGDEMPASFGARIKQSLPIGILQEHIVPLWAFLTSETGQRRYRGTLTKLRSQGDINIWEVTNLTVPHWTKLLWDLVQTLPNGGRPNGPAD